MSRDSEQLWLASLQQRIEAFYSALAAERDVSPAVRYRLEGALEGALATGQLTRSVLLQWVEEAYQAAFSESLYEAFAESRFSELQCDLESAVRLPWKMTKAPVYPSGGD